MLSLRKLDLRAVLTMRNPKVLIRGSSAATRRMEKDLNIFIKVKKQEQGNSTTGEAEIQPLHMLFFPGPSIDWTSVPSFSLGNPQLTHFHHIPLYLLTSNTDH